jgi:hypothetical protein
MDKEQNQDKKLSIILTIPKTFTQLDTNYHATIQSLSRFFRSEKARVLVCVQLNTGELTLFPTLFAPTKPLIEASDRRLL